MAALPERFKRIKSVLNCGMQDLTVLIEGVNKVHNLSAILRTCDAVGVYEANFISKDKEVKTFNSTAQGSQKWIRLNNYKSHLSAIDELKDKGFKLYGTSLKEKSIDYRDLDFTKDTCFVLGAEKWGLSDEIIAEVDECIHIPMHGMVQSLNVSVAAGILLFEAMRQRKNKDLLPSQGEGLDKEIYNNTLFEWTYPELISTFKNSNRKYPQLDKNGNFFNQALY